MPGLASLLDDVTNRETGTEGHGHGSFPLGRRGIERYAANDDMGQSIVVVDAFANEPFTGNPAGVCLLPGPADERWMQLVARELNLSETAFLQLRGTLAG